MADTERLRIALITHDVRLRTKFREYASRTHTPLTIAWSQKDVQSVLADTELRVRIVDYSSTKLLPENLVRAHAFLGGKPDDLVVVTLSGNETEGERRVAFSRKRVDLLFAELTRAEPEKKTADAADAILGESDAILRVRDQIRHVARFSDVPVMILGETGTGKELVADAIHKLGTPTEPLIAVNCAAIPSELVESELFGHEAGAYTGARAARTGLLEAAGQGVIFLDEIGEMPLSLQPKLLRALEQRKFRRVGATADIAFSARVVSATNRALTGGTLRSDLRYRLAGFTISLPPLRARGADVELLASSFLRDFGDRHKLSPIWFTTEALAVLRLHSWPGNVRELRGAVQHAAIVAGGRAVDEHAVAQALLQTADAPAAPLEVHETRVAQAPRVDENFALKDRERDLVIDAFRRAGGNVSQTARMLGIARATLRERLRKYGVRS